MTTKWKTVGSIVSIFVGGADFERLMNGDVDSFFGTRGFLIFLMMGAMLQGVRYVWKACAKAQTIG